VLSAAEPERHRAFLEHVCDGVAERLPGGFTVATDKGRLTLLSPTEAGRRLFVSPGDDGPRFCAVRLEVADLGALAQLLRSNRVEAVDSGGGLLVPATQAHGLALEFVSEGASREAGKL
jgi:hypothetical protein